MILNDADIHKLQTRFGLIKPYNSDQLNAASYDVMVADEWISPVDDTRYQKEEVVLEPGDCVLGCTVEYFSFLTDLAGMFKLKSSLGRLFLNHTLAGWIDPGFKGKLTLEFQNIGVHARILKAGTKVGQVVFMRTTGDAELSPYESKGHYQHQGGVEPSWDESYFKRAK